MSIARTVLPAFLAVLALAACGGDGGGGGADAAGDAAGDVAGDAAPDDAGPTDGGGDDAAGDADDDTGAPPEGPLVPVAGDPNFAVAAAGWYRGDLHYHSNYSGDAEKQGGDPLAMVIAIADAYRDPVFLERNPGLAGNGLDYIAVTDHRTDAALADPDFTHDHLILLRGEEYGGSGHANIWGITHHIPHEPLAGEAQNQRHLDAIEEAHAMGAVFSSNHPLDGNNWVWDTPTQDCVEIWNGPWAGFNRGSTDEELEGDIASGVENPFLRDAQSRHEDGSNAKALRFWQGNLTAGRHLCAVGGSDRHMLVPAALPTTYVRKTDDPAFDGLVGKALGEAGVLAGLRARGTFVSRSPFGAQVELTAEDGDGLRYPMGAELPGPGPYTIHVKVGRAKGGRVQLVAGPLKPVVDGRVEAEPTVVFEADVPADLVEGTFAWTPPAEGGWLHAVVLEPLALGPLPPVGQEALATLSTPRETEGFLLMAEVMLPLVDGSLIFYPENCDPDAWEPWTLQCMPVDDFPPLPTFYFPDELERLMQLVFEGGEPTEWAMGAISSAFMVRPGG